MISLGLWCSLVNIPSPPLFSKLYEDKGRDKSSTNVPSHPLYAAGVYITRASLAGLKVVSKFQTNFS